MIRCKLQIWKNFESEGFPFRVIGFRFENHQVVLENIWVTIDYFPVKTRETGSKISEKYYINNKNCIIFSDKSLSFFNDGGWQGFSNYLKLENSIEDILFSLISNNQDIYLFVDGIDYITSIEKHRDTI